ncbi:DNA-directed RNA polymerase subunit K [Candidatus Micrarchaeota archaeon]|nr:DNA-directed RNA polymerase subunit K [Candidatus Micrarchaeota archaeon]
MAKNVVYTKYEEARIIGSRALQLAMGAPPLVDAEDVKKETNKTYISAVDLAKAEYSKKSIPMQVIGKIQ